MGANNADSGGLGGGVSCQGLLCLVSKGSACSLQHLLLCGPDLFCLLVCCPALLPWTVALWPLGSVWLFVLAVRPGGEGGGLKIRI